MGDSSSFSFGPRNASRLRRLAFISVMAGFLLLPVMPFQFTSILTAVVWSLSGALPGMVFLIIGTFFRTDSLPILSGIQGIFANLFPGAGTSFDLGAAIATMFCGNLAAMFLFRWLVTARLVGRIPPSSRLRYALARRLER